MKVSIVIPVKEINGYILESMRHIRRLDFPDFEVLILPDRDEGIRIDGARIIPTGETGPSEKRDLASTHASGEILAFLDDDAYPEPRWLASSVRHFAEDDVAAVGGPAVTPGDDSALQRASGAVFSSRLVSSSYVYRYVPTVRRDVDDYPTVNLLVRKSVFDRLGGFDTSFWPGEDTKLCLDMTVTLGQRIVYDPEALVYHHRRSLFIPHLSQVARYAFQRGSFVRTHPETSLRPGYFVPSAFVAFLVAGPVAAAFSTAAQVVFAAVLAVYLAAVGAAVAAAVLRERSLAVGLLAAPGILTTHLVYGYNFLKGLVAAGTTPAGVRGGPAGGRKGRIKET